MLKASTEEELPFIKQLYLDKNGKFGGEKFYHKTLSLMCQRLESRLMYGFIAPELIRQGAGPIITIHDSFIVAQDKVDLTKDIIYKSFEKVGLIKPRLKDELLTLDLFTQKGSG